MWCMIENNILSAFNATHLNNAWGPWQCKYMETDHDRPSLSSREDRFPCENTCHEYFSQRFQRHVRSPSPQSPDGLVWCYRNIKIWRVTRVSCNDDEITLIASSLTAPCHMYVYWFGRFFRHPPSHRYGRPLCLLLIVLPRGGISQAGGTSGWQHWRCWLTATDSWTSETIASCRTRLHIFRGCNVQYLPGKTHSFAL